jgi:hypothetical protein
MKSLLLKTIALLSILLSSLGPQVASGSVLESPEAPATAPASSALPVITASSDAVVEVVTGGQDCGIQPVMEARFDLLLWHACDFSLQLGVVTTSEVVVVQPEGSQPELTVQQQPQSVIASWYHTRTSEPLDNLNAFGPSITGRPELTKGIVQRPNSDSVVISAVAQTLTDNSQDSIVLRC